jgi:hypothetical protein
MDFIYATDNNKLLGEAKNLFDCVEFCFLIVPTFSQFIHTKYQLLNMRFLKLELICNSILNHVFL